MKVGDWDMIPLQERRKKGRKEDIQVRTMMAIHEDRRVLVHRVEKRNPDGTSEVFIIKANPEPSTDH